MKKHAKSVLRLNARAAKAKEHAINSAVASRAIPIAVIAS